MNLLDKYILEIGKRLPRKNRLDLQAEIRSTIEDMLEDRSRESGRAVDEALIGEVLQEYGAPAKVAAAYQPTRYLIGPRLYPFFEKVVMIVVSVLTAFFVIGFGVSFASGSITGPAFITALGQHLLQYLTGVISAFGNMVLVFAILERVLPAAEFEEKAETWTPADLDTEPDPDQVKRGELIFEILLILLGLAVFNLYPSLIGIKLLEGGAWVNTPALSEAFFRYLPWINLLGMLEILLNLYLLRQGFWQPATRLFNLAIQVAGIVLAGIMLVGPSLVSLDPEKLADVLGQNPDAILRIVSTLPVIVLLIVIIVQSIEVLQIIWRLLNRRSVGKTYSPN